MRRPTKIKLKNGEVRYQLRWADSHGENCWKRFRTKREADALAAQIDTEKRSGLVVSHDVRLGELIDEWRAEHLDIALRPSAKKDYEAALARILAHFGPRRHVRAIAPKEVGEFRDTALKELRAARLDRFERVQRKPEDVVRVRTSIESGGTRTINKCIGALRTLLKFAQGNGYVSINAAAHTKKFRVESARTSRWTRLCCGPPRSTCSSKRQSRNGVRRSASWRLVGCAWVSCSGCSGAMWNSTAPHPGASAAGSCDRDLARSQDQGRDALCRIAGDRDA